MRATLSIAPGLKMALKSETLQKRIGKQLNALGAELVKYAKREFLTGGTTKTATAVRSGERRNAYSHKLTNTSKGWELDYGPIRSKSGKVPVHVRVHEGYNAQGQEVDQFVIVPRHKKALRFAVYKVGKNGKVKGGLSKKNVEKYVYTKRVVLRPRPTFPAVREKFEKEWPAELGKAFEENFRLAGAR